MITIPNNKFDKGCHNSVHILDKKIFLILIEMTSKQLIQAFDKAINKLGNKANPLNLFLEGYANGIQDKYLKEGFIKTAIDIVIDLANAGIGIEGTNYKVFKQEFIKRFNYDN